MAEEGGSLPAQAGFASWWSQSASLRSNDASSCTRVFSWSPQGSTILGMIYSSRKMKRRGLRSMFMSCFSHFWSLAEAASSSAEDTKEPPSTSLTPDVHHRALIKLSPSHRGSGNRKQVQQPAGPGSEPPAQKGSPKHFQEGCGGSQQTNATHTPSRQLKPQGLWPFSWQVQPQMTLLLCQQPLGTEPSLVLTGAKS